VRRGFLGFLEVLKITSLVLRPTPVLELHVVFKIPYLYDYATQLCRTQAEVIPNHINPNVRGIV
jgi:hypothetical protein